MSTWTSRAAGAALPILLAGCLAATAPRVVTLGEGAGAFAVAAPLGYCAATRSVARLESSDFAAFARCQAAGTASPVLTATVGAAGSGAGGLPASTAMAAFFTSPEGRRALSRSDDPGSVTVHEVVAVEGTLLIRFTDLAPGSPGEGQAWRAILTVGDRLVTLSVTGGRGAALASETGQALILDFVAAVRRAN